MADTVWFDMENEIKPFDESTLADAKLVGGVMYSPNVFPLLEKILANPLREENSASSAGDIVYQAGLPVAFQAAILRRLYIGHRSFIGIVGSTLCSRPETSPVLLMKLMKETIKPRYGSKLFFANTAIPISARMNRMLGVRGEAPSSCSYVRFVVFKYGMFARFASKGRVPLIIARCIDMIGNLFSVVLKRKRQTVLACRVESEIGADFDIFWDAYLRQNKGVVTSRSRKELVWMFQAGISAGRVVLLSLQDKNEMKGYVIAKASDPECKRWMLVDWIAIGNDSAILGDLLHELVRYLKLEKSAVWLESVGYPDYIQPIIKRHLPFRRHLKENVFLYKSFDSDVTETLSHNVSANWFFGAYDGDRCF